MNASSGELILYQIITICYNETWNLAHVLQADYNETKSSSFTYQSIPLASKRRLIWSEVMERCSLYNRKYKAIELEMVTFLLYLR